MIIKYAFVNSQSYMCLRGITHIWAHIYDSHILDTYDSTYDHINYPYMGNHI